MFFSFFVSCQSIFVSALFCLPGMLCSLCDRNNSDSSEKPKRRAFLWPLQKSREKIHGYRGIRTKNGGYEAVSGDEALSEQRDEQVGAAGFQGIIFFLQFDSHCDCVFCRLLVKPFSASDFRKAAFLIDAPCRSVRFPYF